MTYNDFFDEQKFSKDEIYLLSKKVTNVLTKVSLASSKPNLVFIHTLFMLLSSYPTIFLATIILQAISFSSFSKGISAQEERFEIRNSLISSKQYSIVSKSIKQAEKLLHAYHKDNYQTNIDKKVNIVFLSEEQMRGALGAYSPIGIMKKPTIYLTNNLLKY